MKTVVYRRYALKALSRMPGNVSARIRSKIEQYAQVPSELANNVKALKDRPGYRLRVGDWRVIFDEDDVVVDVIEIGARGGVYD